MLLLCFGNCVIFILVDSFSLVFLMVMVFFFIWLISCLECLVIFLIFWLGNMVINLLLFYLLIFFIGLNMVVRSVFMCWSLIFFFLCFVLLLIVLNLFRLIKIKIKCCFFCINLEMDLCNELWLERLVNLLCNVSWCSLVLFCFLLLMLCIVVIK